MSIGRSKQKENARTRANDERHNADQKQSRSREHLADADGPRTTNGQRNRGSQRAQLEHSHDLLDKAAQRIGAERARTDPNSADAPVTAAKLAREVRANQEKGLELRRVTENRVTAVLDSVRRTLERQAGVEAGKQGPAAARNVEMLRDQLARLEETTTRAVRVLDDLAKRQDLGFTLEHLRAIDRMMGKDSQARSAQTASEANRSRTRQTASQDVKSRTEQGRSLDRAEYTLLSRRLTQHIAREAAELRDRLRPAVLDRIRQRLVGVDGAAAQLSDDAISRVAQEARKSKQDKRLDAARGQLTEELMHVEQERRATQLGFEYVRGDRIRDESGNKFTDAVMLRQADAARAGLAEALEAKAGTESARGLTEKWAKETKKDMLERLRYERDIETHLSATQKEAGQLESTRERLAETEKARRLFIDGEERRIEREAPVAELVRGVVPRGTANAASAIELSSTEAQIREAARVILDELDEVEP